MKLKSRPSDDAANPERLRTLAQRCRDLSEMTVVPEVTRELVRIADELDDEADHIRRK
ncbi:MAG TPA: hypothetical protein VF342_16975 [Alphaproteobacteria bacterium]